MSSEADQKACMQLIAEWANEKDDSFPKELKDLLIKLGFPRVLVVERTPPELLQAYEARLYDKINVQAETPADKEAVLAQYPLAHKFQAHIVPMVRYNEADGQAIKSFPAGSFAAVDIKAPGARVVVTPQLTGCSFVIGFDKKNKNRCLFGYAQPGKSPPPAPPAAEEKKGEGEEKKGEEKKGLSSRAQLAQHFKEADGKTIFAGEEVKEVYVMGGDSKGYDDDTADVLGWISGGKFFLAVWTRRAKKLTIKQYPPSLVDRLRK